MIAFCAECESENEIEVLGKGYFHGYMEYSYVCSECGYEAVEETEIEN